MDSSDSSKIPDHVVAAVSKATQQLEEAAKAAADLMSAAYKRALNDIRVASSPLSSEDLKRCVPHVPDMMQKLQQHLQDLEHQRSKTRS